MNHAIEIINLQEGVNYSPTFVSTDRRSNVSTSLGYMQIGESAQEGNAKGPIFRVEFVDLSQISTATHIKIWGLENGDANAPIYPITYLTTWKPTLDLYLKKFIFCDSAGEPVEEAGEYSIFGHKRKTLPTVY
jgi:hypothetical protein